MERENVLIEALVGPKGSCECVDQSLSKNCKSEDSAEN